MPAIHKALYQGGIMVYKNKHNIACIFRGYNLVGNMKQKIDKKKIKHSVMSVLRYENHRCGK